jgi:conjugative transposon TraM protein
MSNMKKENIITEKEKRFLLIVPLIIFPLLTLGFWAMGGGKGNAETIPITGFNSNLPEAHLSNQELDKLGHYEEASKDSMRRRDAARNDPYYMGFDDQSSEEEDEFLDFEGFMKSRQSSPVSGEEQVYEKLHQLNTVLDQSSGEYNYQPQKQHSFGLSEQASIKEDITRLEQMMLLMQQEATAEDPEMEQINSMLQNVLDIQHPERVQDRLRQTSNDNRGRVYAVNGVSTEDPISLLDNKSVLEYAEEFNSSVRKKENQFFGMDGNSLDTESGEPGAIEAIVHETQTLVSGATVKLRLMQDVYVNGERIPKDNFVFGIASLNGERLEIQIDHIRINNYLMAVHLAVHDLDGMPGIQVPGAISLDVTKQSGDRAIQSMNMGIMNQTLGAQAASAGIELGRNLLSRKIKLIKVEVKAGYKVYLKDNKRKEY